LSSPLHPIEVKVLDGLNGKDWVEFSHLVAESGLQADQVRRSIEWLSSKSLIEVKESLQSELVVSDFNPPELAIVDALAKAQGPVGMDDLKRSFSSSEEFSAGLGRARSSGWIAVRQGPNGQVVLPVNLEAPQALKNLLDEIHKGVHEADLPPSSSALLGDLLKRGLLRRTVRKTTSVKITVKGEREISGRPRGDYLERLTPETIASGSWKARKLRPIDVESQAPAFFPGRRHPVRDFIREVREVYISMGFTELEGNSVQPSFWNFDALFIPQDHPGREMQDTFYLSGFVDKSIERSGLHDRVASTHEHGWTTGSRGWGYRWRVEEARRLVLRTHNTVLTIRALAESGEREVRAFAVSKVYRNENLDYKHLAEFHQMDGIMAGKELNMRHLLGFLKEFYAKLGMRDVKLWPTYFPYTEPSLQVMGYSDVVKDWIELGGSGVFRPEVTRPLGIRTPVLAWGPGIERLMLLRYGLDDIRSLYDGDLKWLRNRVEYASSST
jgi:phenylalanyl-tRNA synthetase alpha chain